MPDEERKRRAAAVTAKIMRELQLGTEEEIEQIEKDLKETTLDSFVYLNKQTTIHRLKSQFHFGSKNIYNVLRTDGTTGNFTRRRRGDCKQNI